MEVRKLEAPLEKTAKKILKSAIARIHASVGWDSYNALVHANLEKRPDDFFMAEEEGEMVGYAAIRQENGETYHLDHIAAYALSNGERKGIGLGLMLFVIEKVKEVGALNLTLHFRGNTGLVRFYSRVGEEGTKEGLISEVIMENTGTIFYNYDPRWKVTYLISG
jgi:hypothetical protein